MAPRSVMRPLVAAAAALAIGACGGSSRTSPASHSGTTTAPAIQRSATFSGKGFTISVPSGYRNSPGTISGLPAGAWQRRLTDGGVASTSANAEVLMLVNPHLQMDVDQVATNLREVDSSDRELSHVHTSVKAVTVAGAQAAREVTETYTSRYTPSSQDTTRFERTWLMVMPKPGTLIDVVVVNEPDRGGNLDPSAILSSFQLRG